MSTMTYHIFLVDDQVAEIQETFEIVLDNSSGRIMISQDSLEVTVLDDDSTGTEVLHAQESKNCSIQTHVQKLSKIDKLIIQPYCIERFPIMYQKRTLQGFV